MRNRAAAWPPHSRFAVIALFVCAVANAAIGALWTVSLCGTVVIAGKTPGERSSDLAVSHVPQ